MLFMKHGMKRGLSDVVTTVLIILLVLAAVAIIWGYLRGSLVQSGQQITGQTACLNLDLKAISCNVSANSASATVKYGRNSGDANLTKVTVVFLDAAGQSTTNSAVSVPNPLETVLSTTNGFTAVTKPVSVSVAGTVATSAGDQNLCDRSDPVVCS